MNAQRYSMVEPWMINQFELCQGELIVYSYMYGMTMHDAKYQTSLTDLMNNLALSKAMIAIVLNKLVEKGYLAVYVPIGGKNKRRFVIAQDAIKRVNGCSMQTRQSCIHQENHITDSSYVGADEKLKNISTQIEKLISCWCEM